MKLATTLFATFLCSLLSGRAEILLKGIMISDGVPAFSLYSVEDQTTKWVPLGKSFAGFKVVDFDPQAEVLTVAKDDTRKELRMEQSKIKVSVEDANARLKTAQGVELAYELLKEKDRLLLGLEADGRLLLRGFEQTVKSYQSISFRMQDLAEAQARGGLENSKASSAMEFLTRKKDELRGEVEKGAIELRAAALKIPANGISPTSLSSLEAELAVEREKAMKAEEASKRALENLEKQMRERPAGQR